MRERDIKRMWGQMLQLKPGLNELSDERLEMIHSDFVRSFQRVPYVRIGMDKAKNLLKRTVVVSSGNVNVPQNIPTSGVEKTVNKVESSDSDGEEDRLPLARLRRKRYGKIEAEKPNQLANNPTTNSQNQLAKKPTTNSQGQLANRSSGSEIQPSGAASQDVPKRKRGRPSLACRAQFLATSQQQSAQQQRRMSIKIPEKQPQTEIPQKQQQNAQQQSQMSIKIREKQPQTETPQKQPRIEILQKLPQTKTPQKLEQKPKAQQQELPQPKPATTFGGSASPPIKKRKTKSNAINGNALTKAHTPPSAMNLKVSTENAAAAIKDAANGNEGVDLRSKSIASIAVSGQTGAAKQKTQQELSMEHILYDHDYMLPSPQKNDAADIVGEFGNSLIEELLGADDRSVSVPRSNKDLGQLLNEALNDTAVNEIEQLVEEAEAENGIENIESAPGEVQEIDRCLKSFNSKTPSEIDHEIADTSEFFEKKTPLELEAAMHDLLIYDDDDDDVLSVAASWDGWDEEEPKAPPPPAAKPAKQPTAINDNINGHSSETDNLRSFRIPKVRVIQPGDDKGKATATQQKKLPPPMIVPNHVQQQQPQVMRSLYQQLEPKQQQQQQQAANVLPCDTSVPPPSTNLGRFRTPINRHNSVSVEQAPMPIFAPPYRLPDVPQRQPQLPPMRQQQSPLPQQFLNSSVEDQQPMLMNWTQQMFGVKCFRYLDNNCGRANCNHSLNGPGEVLYHLNKLDNIHLNTAYKHIVRSCILLQAYFPQFATIFGDRKMMAHLVQMVHDCRLYKEHCAPFVFPLFNALLQSGMGKVDAACLIKNCLWMTSSAIKYRPLITEVLRILACSNWQAYMNDFFDLFNNQRFPTPKDFLITIVKEALEKDDPGMNDDAWNLVLFIPIDHNDDTLASVLNIFVSKRNASRPQQWNGQMGMGMGIQQQQQQQQQQGPSFACNFSSNFRPATNQPFSLISRTDFRPAEPELHQQLDDYMSQY